MDYYIIIPAHNEEAFLGTTLDSIVHQTLVPKKLVVVNDHSTDATGEIIARYERAYSYITSVQTVSSHHHLPGSKVINAFLAGLAVLDDSYDFIVKLDADLILPPAYFETIAKIFRENKDVGIAGGFFHEREADGTWRLHHPMDKDHIRGAFKSYTRACFTAIGGLKNAMGWDTLDELLARFHGFELYTDSALIVKNLRPVGSAYDRRARLFQGIAMYRMRYGLWITLLASLKMAWKKRNVPSFFDNLKGYWQAGRDQMPFLVNPEEGAFIRSFRRKRIWKKLL